MGVLDALLQGFLVALQPLNLFWALVGCALGTAIGVLPGIGPALTITLLLPVTVSLSPTAAFIIFAGIFYGAMYGGSTTSILINTPGESGSMITALEGNKMAKRGRGAAALATAAIGSFVAGTIGTMLLTVAAPAISEIAFIFGPAEYFALAILSFTSVSVVLGGSVSRGLLSLLVGLGMALVGVDYQTGQPRLAFDIPQLLDGVGITIVLVAMFAVGELLYVAGRLSSTPQKVIEIKGPIAMSREDWSRSWKPWLRGSLIGFPIGVMPAGGSEIPTLLSYTVERRLAKKPEEFGHGAIEGVAGPEAANNAAVAGVMVPLLTLGLPTSATAAVMLAAFQNYGLNPGPTLFTTNTELVWGVIASLYIGNFMLLILNLPMAKVWVKLLSVPAPQLYGGILVFSLVGVWGVSRSWVDLLMLCALGATGYLFRRYSVPIAPALIGLILGPMAELQLRRALAISQGDPMTLVSTPVAAGLLLVSTAVLLVPLLRRAKAAA
ncbi:tripartite tricarboxylate transporter permease [uncultured Alsobacter sp.]|uniref:tripartite tricarboxylate transporter permease n=1 Tax=uncultured Alsobacter sp. TaxID=1748258 RepID=UPI0026013384|nr:tripartite tricarboxylate transporter permease [uncultured Alsobacter sp.]